MLLTLVGTAGSASRDVSSIASTRAIPAFVALLAVTAALVQWLRRAGRTTSPWLLFASLASLCLVVSVTLLRGGWTPRFDLRGLSDWSGDGWDTVRSDPFASGQFLLNLVLFVPAGALWTWMTRRPGRVLVLLVAGSFAIESVQAVTGLGAPDVADVVANAIGAVLGVGVGAAALRVARRGPAAWSTRRRMAAAASVVAVGLVLTLLLFSGAGRHQRSIRHELEARFAGTTIGDVERWEAEDHVTDEVFGAISVHADGARYSPGQVEVRYPATFFGLRRCVVVVWTSAGVEFHQRSGHACTDLMS